MTKKTYRLLGSDGQNYETSTPGALGGNAKDKIYGRLNCGTALASIGRHGESYTKHRVFFADEEAAIGAGYRPCGNCLRRRYVEWKKARESLQPAADDVMWWKRAQIAKPAENTAGTEEGGEVATDLDLAENTSQRAPIVVLCPACR